jgi:hypothetical protein
MLNLVSPDAIVAGGRNSGLDDVPVAPVEIEHSASRKIGLFPKAHNHKTDRHGSSTS